MVLICLFGNIAGPLSASDLSSSWGVSGAYSETAAEKAYPNCEAVPCEQFDIAFEVTYCGEVQLPIRHCLLANHGVRVEDLTRVLSHPQALAQCENTLTTLRVIREAVDNTAGAAQFVALHKLKDTTDVASLGAARVYDMNVLAQDIQDDADNITRFLMLAREPVIPGTDRPFKVDPTKNSRLK
ncbi:arogenate dehydratase 2 [Actinidia rufa]|uniref:Arogenate dehydratase 2 n=1 Tax=Actinidia rufa TaxID=165716 RepID=A0A7J0EDM6_9ERIC|nr:arogenate dehydratase 2 [Actinidia rufa]